MGSEMCIRDSPRTRDHGSGDQRRVIMIRNKGTGFMVGYLALASSNESTGSPLLLGISFCNPFLPRRLSVEVGGGATAIVD